MPRRLLLFASDHAGLSLKRHLMEFARGEGCDVEDLGTHDDASCDYPDYAARMGAALPNHRDAVGVLICGSGIGISIAANRYPHLRCALVRSPLEARLARQHNDANAIALGERLTTPLVAEACLRAFLDTEFDGGRHTARVRKMDVLPLEHLD